jgi:hypothetical protein
VQFTRGRAVAYLVALAVWLGGFLALGFGGDDSVDSVPESVVLGFLFVAACVIGAVAWLVSGETSWPRAGSAGRPSGVPRMAGFGICWVALMVGAGVPAALHAMDPSS